MKYIDEYRDKTLVAKLTGAIRAISKKKVALMEVCGGHTMAIHRYGIPSLLPGNIKLLSGPGCPVCVSSRQYIDKAVAYSRLPDAVVTTFGDLLRVPGSESSLEKEKARGADVRVVYSILDAIGIAEQHRDKKIIFLGIGFETTAPGSAAGILTAHAKNLDNFFLFSAHKVMPPAMKALIDEGIKIDGYIAPGHVSTITGSEMYREIPEKYGLGCVIAGFEPVDILQSIYMLVKQIETKTPRVEIQYRRAVKPEGNLRARALLEEVFTFRDDWWRGLGILPNSGLRLKEKYRSWDAEQMIPVTVAEARDEKGCLCGEVLKGLKIPTDCTLFGKACTPSDPVGACMVSNEGSCNAFYRYGE
jgi:hydrogenase expression/formation protein HypD